MSLTTQQLENVITAIRRAKKPGGCKYAVKTLTGHLKPVCVIGQLLYIENSSLFDTAVRLPSNKGYVDLSENDSQIKFSDTLQNHLKSYPPNLLAQLQDSWDEASSGSVADKRKDLRRILNNFISGKV